MWILTELTVSRQFRETGSIRELSAYSNCPVTKRRAVSAMMAAPMGTRPR